MLDVPSWLAGLGLATYARVFAENAIDADVLPDLTDADLDKLGIPLGHRKKLLRAIDSLEWGGTPGNGEPVVAPPDEEPRFHLQAERRQLTILFVDLVNSTGLSADLGPEELAEVLGSYRSICAREVARFHGTVTRFLGDGVLAYFGWPHAREDAAEGAVRASLAIVDAMATTSPLHGRSLSVRIGIASGSVVVGDLVADRMVEHDSVIGETPNLAFRIQSMAEPNSVLIAHATRGLIGDLFDLEHLGPTRFKGFADPVDVWRVLRGRDVPSRFLALHGHFRDTPFIGRERELSILHSNWLDSRTGSGRVVLILGEAGIGKSRLIEV